MKKQSSYWIFVTIFLLVFLASTAAQLPASFVFGKTQGIEGQFQGAIWNAKADALRVRGQVVRNVSLVVDFWPLLTGTVSGLVKADDPSVAFYANFEKNGRHLTLKNYQASLQQPTNLYGQTFITQSDVQGDVLIVDSNTCVDGQFNLSTNLVRKLVEKLGADAPVLSGTGVCENGGFRLMLKGSGPVIALDVNAYAEADDLRANVMLTPKIEALPVHMHQLLTLAGLQFDGRVYKGQIQLKS